MDVQGRRDKDAVPDVGPRTVSEVVTQPRQLDALDVLVRDAERAVHVSEVCRHEPGEITHAWPGACQRWLGGRSGLETHRESVRTGYARRRERHSM